MCFKITVERLETKVRQKCVKEKSFVPRKKSDILILTNKLYTFTARQILFLLLYIRNSP